MIINSNNLILHYFRLFNFILFFYFLKKILKYNYHKKDPKRFNHIIKLNKKDRIKQKFDHIIKLNKKDRIKQRFNYIIKLFNH